ncbi:MAG TPA: hypothetical protein VIY48_06730 [Candidatus Paceibacterota bacterium]
MKKETQEKSEDKNNLKRLMYAAIDLAEEGSLHHKSWSRMDTVRMVMALFDYEGSMGMILGTAVFKSLHERGYDKEIIEWRNEMKRMVGELEKYGKEVPGGRDRQSKPEPGVH